MSFLRFGSKSSEELESDLAQVKALLDSAYNALLIVDDEQTVLALNEAAAALFDCPDPAGKRLEEVTQSSDLSAMVDDLLVNPEEGFEAQVTLKARHYRVRVRMAESAAVCLALDDVTDLVRLNRARRDMVANISHELRTPIANIRLIIDGLFHETERPKRKKSISSLHAIAQETDALLWMADELLDLSMIESGQAIIRMVEEPAQLIAEQAIERVEDQSAAKELEVINDVDEDIMVLCDFDKARRVLVNLVHNAVKWSPPGETISVHAERDGDEVTISVFDNGPGVKEEQKERIFERFYQEDTSRSMSDGTGLGLAICKHIVEAHGGHIWAEGNSERSGGRFFFTLPAGDPPKAGQ